MAIDRKIRLTDQAPPNIAKSSIAVVIAVTTVLIYLLQSILVPFIGAAAIAYVTMPLIDWLEERLSLWRWLVVNFVFIIVVGIVGGVVLLIAIVIMHDVNGLGRQITSQVHLISSQLFKISITVFGNRLDVGDIFASIIATLKHRLADPEPTVEAIKWSAQAFFDAILTIVLLYYFMLSGRRLARGTLWLVPPGSRPILKSFFQRFDGVIRRYIVGVLAIVLYTATLTWIVTGPVLALPNPLLLAITTGVLEPIPFFGPLLGPIIVGIVALKYGDVISFIGYVFCAVVLRLSIDEIVGPLVLGTAVHLPPSVVILALLVGWTLFGFIGILLAVPVAAGLRLALGILYGEEEAA